MNKVGGRSLLADFHLYVQQLICMHLCVRGCEVLFMFDMRVHLCECVFVRARVYAFAFITASRKSFFDNV